jgi:hypothetical protein
MRRPMARGPRLPYKLGRDGTALTELGRAVGTNSAHLPQTTAACRPTPLRRTRLQGEERNPVGNRDCKSLLRGGPAFDRPLRTGRRTTSAKETCHSAKRTPQLTYCGTGRNDVGLVGVWRKGMEFLGDEGERMGGHDGARKDDGTARYPDDGHRALQSGGSTTGSRFGTAVTARGYSGSIPRLASAATGRDQDSKRSACPTSRIGRRIHIRGMLRNGDARSFLFWGIRLV